LIPFLAIGVDGHGASRQLPRFALGCRSNYVRELPRRRQGLFVTLSQATARETVLTLRMLTNDGVDVHLYTGMGGTGCKGSLRVRWWWKSLTTGGEEDDHEHGFLDSRSCLVRRARGDGVLNLSRTQIYADQDSAACDCDAGSSAAGAG